MRITKGVLSSWLDTGIEPGRRSVEVSAAPSEVPTFRPVRRDCIGEAGSAAESLSGPPPLFVGELRVEGARGALFVVDDGSLSIQVDSRSEGEEIIAGLREAALPAPPVLDCRTLWRLELGGAPHDPDSQEPDSEWSCECVRRNPNEGFAALGMMHFPAASDDPGACRCGEDFTYQGVKVRLCCRCTGALSSKDFAEAAQLLSGVAS